jgi:MFS family permease
MFFLATAVLLSMSLWFSASAVVPQLAEEWSLSTSMQAWMTMSVQLGFVAGALFSAILNLSDRFSAPRVVAFSATLGAIFNACIPLFSEGPESALVFRFLTGAMLAGVYPPGMKIMASWCKEDRGKCIGMLVAALTLGSGMPHLLKALSAASTALPMWHQVLYGTSVQSLIAAAIALFLIQSGPHLGQTAQFDWRQATSGLTDRPTRLANFGYFGHMWELYATVLPDTAIQPQDLLHLVFLQQEGPARSSPVFGRTRLAAPALRVLLSESLAPVVSLQVFF